MKLETFDKIKNGMKIIEFRLYDEKRQQVKVGNFVEFSILEKKLGYKADEMPEPNHMDAYYSREKRAKYDVVGIEIEALNL